MRHDLRLVPAAVMAWIGAFIAVMLGMRWQSALAGAAVALAATTIPLVLLVAHASRRTHVGVALLLACTAAVLAPVATGIRVAQVTRGPVAQAADLTAVVTAHVVLTTDLIRRPAAVRGGRELPESFVAGASSREVTLRGTTFATRVPVRLAIPADACPEVLEDDRAMLPGTHLVVRARAAPALVGQRSAATLIVFDCMEVAALPGVHQRAAGTIRAGLRDAVADRPPDAAALLPGLAVGDTSLAREELTEAMRRTGLAHLTAVSGANVTIVLGSVLGVLLLFGIPVRVSAVIAGLVLLGFVIVARPEPSVLRASVMGAIAVFAIAAGWSRTLSGGATRATAALSAAILVLLLVDPWLATSWGFALSVGATAGLVMLARPLAHRLGAGRRRLWTPVAHALAVTIAAQIAVSPLLIAMGAPVGPISVPANLLAAPAVAPATVSGLAAAVVSPLSPTAAEVIALPGAWSTGWIARVAHTADDLRHDPRLAWPPSWLPSLPSLDRWPDQRWQVVVCDVGQGSALVVRTGQQRGVVVDVGQEPDDVDRCLRDLDIRRIEALVLTHMHLDHIGGIEGALRGRAVDAVVTSTLAAPAEQVDRVRDVARSFGVALTLVDAPQRWRFGDVVVEVIWPIPPVVSESPENDASLSMIISTADITVFVGGDLEPTGQDGVAQQMRARGLGPVDVMVVPHHGSRRQSGSLARITAPRVALISVGENDYGHPHPETLALYGRTGAHLARTDHSGDLLLAADAQGIYLLTRR